MVAQVFASKAATFNVEATSRSQDSLHKFQARVENNAFLSSRFAFDGEAKFDEQDGLWHWRGTAKTWPEDSLARPRITNERFDVRHWIEPHGYVGVVLTFTTDVEAAQLARNQVMDCALNLQVLFKSWRRQDTAPVYRDGVYVVKVMLPSIEY